MSTKPHHRNKQKSASHQTVNNNSNNATITTISSGDHDPIDEIVNDIHQPKSASASAVADATTPSEASPSKLSAFLSTVNDNLPSFLVSLKNDVLESYYTLRYSNPRHIAHQVLSLLLILSTAVIIWKSLVLLS